MKKASSSSSSNRGMWLMASGVLGRSERQSRKRNRQRRGLDNNKYKKLDAIDSSCKVSSAS